MGFLALIFWQEGDPKRSVMLKVHQASNADAKPSVNSFRCTMSALEKVGISQQESHPKRSFFECWSYIKPVTPSKGECKQLPFSNVCMGP